VVGVGGAAALAGDWPQWRGPEGTGRSGETGLPVLWHEGRNIRWKCPLPGPAASTPVVWRDAVLLTAHTEDDRLLLLRVDKSSGRIVWQRQVGQGTAPRNGPRRSPQKAHRFYSPAGPSPVTDGRVVVAHFGNGDLAAYDLDGQLLWKRNLQDDYGPYTSWYGHANSPVIAGDLVISVCMQDSLADLGGPVAESYLVGHDLATGRVRWKTTRSTSATAEQCDAYTTPLLCRLHGQRQLVVMGANELDAYDPVSGRRLWWLPNLVGGRTVSGPVVWDDLVIATRGLRGAMLAVRPRPEGELSPRDVVWTYGEGSPDACSPVVWNDLVFTITDDGIARCFEASSGRLRWKERLKGQYKASPVAAEGRVFFLNIDGLCTVVSAAPRFDRLAENALSDTTLASPAISDGLIFIRGYQALYAIGK
jgi:outer membrane protein assembly factor BamB